MPYHYPVREKVLPYIRNQNLMQSGERVAVAVSGGADSVALLRILLELRAELGIVLAVAHFNHGLRGEASLADEAFVAELAKEHALDFFARQCDVRHHAFTRKLSLEAAGREMRYRWFIDLAAEQRLDAIATAHTLDDQAETVLLKFLRGAGTRGLAGIYPLLTPGPPTVSHSPIRVVRPLLQVSRTEVEAYLTSLGQPWREDESNLDRRFLRNRVRHELLPLLLEYNPNLRQTLSDAAELARAEEEYWQLVVKNELVNRTNTAPDEPAQETRKLLLEGFARLPLALQRRTLKRFAESQSVTLDFEQVENLRRCALGETAATELSGGVIASQLGGSLQLRPARVEHKAASDYEYGLPVPGQVWIHELGLTVRALLVPEQFAREAADDCLLRAAALGPELIVRNWRPGDRFRPAHRRSAEKLKRQFADKQIPADQRPSWPVVLCGEEIVWVRDFPVAKNYKWAGQGPAVKIELMAGGSGKV